MKKPLLSILFVCVCLISFAKPVSETTAKKIGLNFLLNNTPHAFIKSDSLKLAYTSGSSNSNTVYYYVFNSDHGFVIVAGDDQATPILGYSDEGTFRPENIPSQVAGWLNGYKNQMAYIVNNNIAATPEIRNKWTSLINNNPQAAPQQTNSGGTPLLTTTWDQLPYYNDQCPYDVSAKRHAVTGCVATAMAQVMKFWNYPTTGIGFHSYNDPNYGTQSASFGGTTYQWSSMPDIVSSANAAVATLMYQCGVSVDMTYGPAESDAYVLSSQSTDKNCAENALKTYFGYDNSLQGILRSNYSTDADWISTVEAEIDAGRPVIYTGTGSGGGHCFVCDGYRSSDNALHFNWGWGGLYNGYYTVNALNPGTGGAGAGSGSYNSNQQAIIGIQPSKALLSYNIGLHSALNLSNNSVTYQKSFTITTSISNLNSGSHNFSGDFCAEIFDSSNNLSDSIIVNYSSTLDVGQNTGTVTFSYPGSATLLPGNYNIAIFFRPAGGNWSIVNGNSYTNQVQFAIKWSNTLELSAPITISPTTPAKNNFITVNLNVINTGVNQFNGSFYAYLYNLDGYPAFLIQKVSGSLTPGSSFANGLTFTNADDTVLPGTYLLVVYYSPAAGQYDLMGSTNYQNPVKVNIAAPPLPPDKYEPDNTVDSAYTFIPNFSGNTAEIKTTGANINTGSDVDYYKINIPAGYYYTFNTSITDLRYQADTQNYTLDGVFSFTGDSGAHWSETYENALPGPLNANGKGAMVFQVAPVFPGATGTYQLDIKITRTVGAGIEKASKPDNADEIKVYPVPATDYVNVDYSNIRANIKQIVIIDLTGKQVLVPVNRIGNTTAQIHVGNLPAGLYILQLKTDNDSMMKRISIVK